MNESVVWQSIKGDVEREISGFLKAQFDSGTVDQLIYEKAISDVGVFANLNRWMESPDIDRTVHTMQDEATIYADPNDRATQETDMALELRNRDRERKLIKKIDETIAKIEADEYGYCEKCGVEIGLKRLEARPTATQCIDCKTLDELRERQVAK